MPRQLAGGGMPGGEAEGLDDRVVERRAHLAYFFIRARGIHAIGEQKNEKAAVGVEPQRSAGESGVAEAMRGEIVARGGVFRGHVPANRAGGIADGYARGEFLDGGAREQAAVRVDSAVENHLREDGQIARGGKKSGVPGDAAHGPGILIVHFAPNEALAKLLVVLGGSDAAPQGLRRIEKRFGHRERLENVAGGESVERFAGEAAARFRREE